MDLQAYGVAANSVNGSDGLCAPGLFGSLAGFDCGTHHDHGRVRSLIAGPAPAQGLRIIDEPSLEVRRERRPYDDDRYGNNRRACARAGPEFKRADREVRRGPFDRCLTASSILCWALSLSKGGDPTMVCRTAGQTPTQKVS